MKKTLLSMLAVAVMCGMASNVAKANIPDPDKAKKGEVWRNEANGGVAELCEPENGVYGLHTFAADAQDWDSQFFIVFSDELVSGGSCTISFDYRKAEGDGDVKFNAQGHADPHTYVNNDGWATLECKEEWQTYTGEPFNISGAIRTFAVNASIGRSNGTLMLRNIIIDIDGDELVKTKETDAEEAELEAAPEVKEPEPMTETDYKTFMTKVDTAAANVAKANFVANVRGTKFVATPVKFGADDVFAFDIDTATAFAWDVQFFAYWALDAVSSTCVSPTEAVLEFDYWTDYAASANGNISHVDMFTGAGNQGAKWGALALAKDKDNKVEHYKDGKPNWVHVADTVKDKRWFWELHLGASKPKVSYSVFLKNVKMTIDGKEIKADAKAVDGVEVKEKGGVAVAEVAAINAYVAGNVLYTSEPANVVIYNINGVAVKAAKNVTTLNVADLKSGLYLAKVGNRVVKFVK